MPDTAAVDIYSPDSFVAGPPHELFARLRRERPVCRQEVATELAGRPRRQRSNLNNALKSLPVRLA